MAAEVLRDAVCLIDNTIQYYLLGSNAGSGWIAKFDQKNDGRRLEESVCARVVCARDGSFGS